MSATRNSTPAHLAAQPTDSGLRCPRCEYNLTGLTEARCPECGALFSWEAVRAAAERRPTIAFERARGWRKIPAFFLTWATVLFAPWVFARQIVQRASVGHALVFAALCFAGTSLAYLSDMDNQFQITWLCTAALYIPLQAVWLSLLDPALRGQTLPTFRFWTLAGCYTSAVMLTEFTSGPPLLYWGELWRFLITRETNWWPLLDLWRLSWSAVVIWAQLALWAAGLSWIWARRVARKWPVALALLFALPVGFSLLNLYGAVVQWIGLRIAKWAGVL